MKIALFFVLLVIAAFTSAQQFQDVFFVDDFEVETPTIIIIIPNNPSFPIVETAFTQDASILGGERDLQLTTLSGNSNLILTAGVASGSYTCSTPNEARGNSLLQYDGIDGTMTLNPSGLGSVNFEQEDAFAIRTEIESDLVTTIDFRAYESGSSSPCTRTVQVPGDDTQNEYILDYTSFSGNCDFSNIGAFEIFVNMADNVDVLITLLSIYGPVPITPSPTRTPTPAPSATRTPTPTPSDTCVCRCPIFVCEVFRVDDGDYYFYNTYFGAFFVQFFQPYFAYFQPTFFNFNFFNYNFFVPYYFNNFFVQPFYYFNFFYFGSYFNPTFFGNFFFDIWRFYFA